MKHVKLSTRLSSILLFCLCISGIICTNFSDDISVAVIKPRMMADGETFVDSLERDNTWRMRLAINEFGSACYAAMPKVLSIPLAADMVVNIAISMSLSDFIAIICGERDRTAWDWGLTVLTILICYYEYRKRRFRGESSSEILS